MRAIELVTRKSEKSMNTENKEELVSSDGVTDPASSAIESGGRNKAPKAKDADNPVEKKPCRSLHWKAEFALLCFMLLVALVGMAVTQASVSGAWEYWLFAVIVFAGIGTFRDFKWARQAHKSVWKSMMKQVIHWSVLLLVMKALFWMERYNAISREASSIAAILLLAMTSIHAGLHFHWTFAIVGVVLAVMSVVLGVLEQSMLLSWLIVLPLVFGGAFLFFLKARAAAR